MSNPLKEAGKGPEDRGDGPALRRRRENHRYWNKTSFHQARKDSKKNEGMTTNE